MNIIHLQVLLCAIAFISSVSLAIYEHKNDNEIILWVAVLGAIASVALALIRNPAPDVYIGQRSDNIIIYTTDPDSDNTASVVYQLGAESNDQWTNYNGPFKPGESGWISARSEGLWYKGKINTCYCYVDEIGGITISPNGPEPGPDPGPPEHNPPSDEYFIFDSDSRKITESDLISFTEDECWLALNEIYARHGRKFKDDKVADYFNSKSWYSGTVDGTTFDNDLDSYLNSDEKDNIETIVSYMRKKGWRS